MREAKAKNWLRIIEIIFGSIIILASIIALLFIRLPLLEKILFLSIALFFMGFTRIIKGVFLKYFSLALHVVDLKVGIIEIILAVVIVAYPQTSPRLLAILLFIPFLFHGIVRVAIYYTEKDLPSWLRNILVTKGIITVLLAGGVVAFQPLDLSIMVSIFSLIFIASGISRIALGIAGY
jgi:uncharacterized membrane protein HdeD (DUF308 family)